MGQNSFILNDNFGIGVSSPSAAISKLTIGSGTNTYPTTPSVGLGAEITLNSSSLARLVMNDGSGNFQQYLNSYYDGTVGVHKYTAAGVQANRFTSSAGTFAFYVAPASVSAGDTITWTTALYIDNSGNVSIGSPTTIENKLHLYSGTSTVSTTQLELEGAPNGYGAGIDFSSRTSSGGTLVSMAKITADGESSWNTTASTQDAGLRFFTTLDGTLTERLRIDSSGNVTVSTGSYISTRANDTADGGGQIYLNGATGNRIDFNINGVAAPAFTTRSVGTRIVLYPYLNASRTDFAFGIESGTLWSSVPENTHQFKWYAGTTNIATLSGAGVLTATTFSGNLTGNAASASSLAADTSTTFKMISFTGVGGDSGNGSVPSSYAIYQQGGSWVNPYPDLCIGYHTGIKIGAYFGYGGVRFYNDSDWATEIFSVGNGDSNVRVVNTIYAGTFSGPLTGNVTGSASTVNASVLLGSGSFPAATSVTIATGALTNYSWLLIHVYNASTSANSRFSLAAVTGSLDTKIFGIATGAAGNSDYIFALVNLDTGYGFSISDPQAVGAVDTSNTANGTTYIKYYGILNASTQVVISPHTAVNFDAGQYYVYGIRKA